MIQGVMPRRLQMIAMDGLTIRGEPEFDSLAG